MAPWFAMTRVGREGQPSLVILVRHASRWDALRVSDCLKVVSGYVDGVPDLRVTLRGWVDIGALASEGHSTASDQIERVRELAMSDQGGLVAVIPFTKMHGIGNDYVFLDAVTDPHLAKRDDLPELSRRISDRNRGVGGDGLIVVQHADKTTAIEPGMGVRMRMFNADGSEAQMCGNGLRCAVKLAVDRGLVSSEAKPMRVQTGAGILTVDYERTGDVVTGVTVDMGEPILDLERVPVDVEQLGSEPGPQVGKAGAVHKIMMSTPGRRRHDPPRELDAIFVSMGNPHAVLFHPEVDMLDLEHVGPMLENHPAFPERINAHFVQIIDRTEVKMRTWERGSGQTMACGTGAAAVCAAGVLREKTDRQLLAHLPGGDLRLHWSPEDHHVYMTGSATEVFRGEWNES